MAGKIGNGFSACTFVDEKALESSTTLPNAPSTPSFTSIDLFRNDIFLAYSRVDGKRYTNAMAAVLISKGYLPLMDSIESRLGESTPRALGSSPGG
jgi:hypothetical protein